METNAELFELRHNSLLKNNVTACVFITAETIRGASPPDPAKRVWAKQAFENPEGEAKRMLMVLLAVKKDVPREDILALPD